MRLGIVSDTHGHLGFAAAAARQLRSLNVGVILHCGDIGSPDIVPVFSDWPAHYVVGNVDDDGAILQEAIEAAGQQFHGEFGDLEFAGVRVALLHSHDRRRFDEVVQSGKYRLVCYGHTHEAESHFVGETLVLNPGALYRATPKSFAVVELPARTVTHHRLEEQRESVV